jgi:hypothetical protein
VVRLEHADTRFYPGHIASTFLEWRRQVHGPRRNLLNGGRTCGCCDPPDRSVLDDALRRLPKRQSRELRRLIAPLDERYLQRTLPDPHAPPGPWWLRRC